MPYRIGQIELPVEFTDVIEVVFTLMILSYFFILISKWLSPRKER